MLVTVQSKRAERNHSINVLPRRSIALVEIVYRTIRKNLMTGARCETFCTVDGHGDSRWSVEPFDEIAEKG